MEQGYDGYGPYSREAYETNLNEFPVIMENPSPMNSQGVSTFQPEIDYFPSNLDPGDISPPPTNNNPTYRVTVEEPLGIVAEPGDYRIPWWLWLAGGYAAYKLLGGRK